jgi:hypothetical protein
MCYPTLIVAPMGWQLCVVKQFHAFTAHPIAESPWGNELSSGLSTVISAAGAACVFVEVSVVASYEVVLVETRRD